MFQSVWTDTGKLPVFEKLEGSAKTDVLIVGGGLCGLLCAHFLESAGVDYILVEGNTIGSGVTCNTTAKITSQHGLLYDRLIKKSGREKASAYLWANQRALKEYQRLSQTIDCDFEEKSGYVYSRENRQCIEDEVRAVNSLGFPAEFSEKLTLPFETAGAVRFPAQAQFHPLKFITGLAKDLKIYEHTLVQNIAEHTAWTDNGEITADKIIVASHFPFLNRHGSYFLKLYQHRSYVIALENAADVGGMYIDEAKNGMSFRNYGKLLLIGGGGHRTGKTGGNWQALRKYSEEWYPGAEERYCWAAQDCMSLDGVPYIGGYSGNTPDLFAATGFNKWGMTGSMISAILLCDMVMERENEWKEIFSPSRSMMKPQLLINSLEAVGSLLTPSIRRCPHMGCALKWNGWEHTWDCPCHGSRFEAHGELIDNPAKRGAKVE